MAPESIKATPVRLRAVGLDERWPQIVSKRILQSLGLLTFSSSGVRSPSRMVVGSTLLCTIQSESFSLK